MIHDDEPELAWRKQRIRYRFQGAPLVVPHGLSSMNRHARVIVSAVTHLIAALCRMSIRAHVRRAAC